MIDHILIDLIVTTGGTGVAKRDVTPEATRLVMERELPGFGEVMRMESYKITPTAMVSRAICGTRKESLIINLPGSPRAATECLGFVLSALPHTLEKLKGDTSDCAVLREGTEPIVQRSTKFAIRDPRQSQSNLEPKITQIDADKTSPCRERYSHQGDFQRLRR